VVDRGGRACLGHGLRLGEYMLTGLSRLRKVDFMVNGMVVSGALPARF